MINLDQFNTDLKIKHNKRTYKCDKKDVLRFNEENKTWEYINFCDIIKGDLIALEEQYTNDLVTHIDGRENFIAKSNAKYDELGLLCFDI